LVVGYALDPWIPIIKRVSTTSFVITSGGWCLLVLAFSYWLIDLKKWQNWSMFFAIVGMNSLFIYLFAHIGGGELVYSMVKPFTMAIFSGWGELNAKMITSSITWLLLWYICYWLYQKRIFIKI